MDNIQIEKPVVDAALDVYCQWLNQWTAQDPGDYQHTYTPSQFYEYGEPHVTVHNHDTSYYSLLVMLVTDGDEGGPATLYVWYHPDNHFPNEPMKICYITQEFDTYLQIIYDTNVPDPHFLNTPLP